MKTSLLLLSLILAGCSTPDNESNQIITATSFVTEDRITPKDETDLRELLLTFNLGDISPENSRHYAYKNALLTDQEIELIADGAIEAKALKKLSTPNHYQYRNGWKGAIGTNIYTLKRENKRWKILDSKTLTSGIAMAGEGPA